MQVFTKHRKALSQAFRQKSVSVAGMLVYLYVADYQNNRLKHGWTFPVADSEIGEALGYGSQSVRKARRELVKKKLLRQAVAKTKSGHEIKGKYIFSLAVSESVPQPEPESYQACGTNRTTPTPEKPVPAKPREVLLDTPKDTYKDTLPPISPHVEKLFEGWNEAHRFIEGERGKFCKYLSELLDKTQTLHHLDTDTAVEVLLEAFKRPGVITPHEHPAELPGWYLRTTEGKRAVRRAVKVVRNRAEQAQEAAEMDAGDGVSAPAQRPLGGAEPDGTGENVSEGAQVKTDAPRRKSEPDFDDIARAQSSLPRNLDDAEVIRLTRRKLRHAGLTDERILEVWRQEHCPKLRAEIEKSYTLGQFLQDLERTRAA